MPTPSKRGFRRIPAPDRLTEAVEPEEDEEEDEQPPAAKTKAEANGDSDESPIRGGWTAGQQTMDSTSNFAQALRLEEKSVIIKFLQDTPFANFRRHWVERSTAQGKSLRAYTCLVPKDCPLCEIGDRAQAVSCFNVAVVGDDGQVLLKSWECGPRLFNVLKAYANDPKIAPLSKGFFVASKTGKRGTVQHNVSPVSRSALVEDYEIEPPAQGDLDKLKLYTPAIIDIPSTKTMRELAEELADEYE